MNNDNVLLFSSQKKYFVKRAVYEAAKKLEQNDPEEVRRLTSFDLFDWQRVLCDDDCSEEILEFWEEVYQYLKVVRVTSDSFDALDQAAIIVDYDVYQGGRTLGKANWIDERGYTDWNLAEENIELCKNSGYGEGVEFFKCVRQYLMEVEFSSKKSILIILV